MTPDRVVIISDCTDCAYAELRGVILRTLGVEGPERRIDIEPLVPVRHFSVVNAAFTLRLLADSYPAGTLFMLIMNSLSERTERIVGRTRRGDVVFEGTNTGALGWIARDFGVAACYELHDPGFVPFGGKRVHAPAVGSLLASVPMDRIGTPFPAERIRDVERGPGTLVHVDNFGNGKFLLAGSFAPDERLRVRIKDLVLNARYGRRMMDHPDGTWVVYPGSSLNLHEIGQVRGKGLLPLEVEPGDVLSIEGGLDVGE